MSIGHKNWSRLALTLSVLGGAGLPLAASAAEGTSGRVLDEIVVTAQRREQSLQDVPVSVGVVSGEQIKELSLQNLDQLSQYVPGLVVREGGEQTTISVRGFGTGLNFGFDQSVGMFIDGIYAGRERQFRGLFLDISSVEVLKGPQSTLFGKSTTAGAIIINTGKPTHDSSAEFGMEYTPETKQEIYRAVLNGGITDTLAGRLALRYSDSEGYLYNTYTDQPEEQERDWTARATFLWEPSDPLTITTKLEHSDYQRTGKNYVVSRISGVAVGRPTCFVPLVVNPICAAGTADVGAAARSSAYLSYDPDFRVHSFDTTSKQTETADFNSDNAMLRVAYEFNADTKLTSISGYSAYESDDERDVDWSPTDYLYEPITQDFSQYSQEFQLEGKIGDKFEYLSGVHWFENDFFVDRRTDVDIRVFLLNPVGVPPVTATSPLPPIWRYAGLRYLDQTTNSISSYISGTYNFTPSLHLNAGVRWTREEKTGADRYALAEFGTNRFLDVQLANPGGPLGAAGPLIGAPADVALINGIRTVLGANVNNILNLSRTGTEDTLIDKNWSPEVKFSWDVTDDVMVYARYARAYKPGGFNSAATGADPVDRTFGTESINAYEIGSKLRLWGGSANVNMAAFVQEVSDQQTSVWGGDAFYVGNAGKSRAQGFEGDITWLATDSLKLNAAFQYLDAKYIENTNVACTLEQRNFNAPGCIYTPASGGRPATFLRDLSGERYAPYLSGSAGASYELHLPLDYSLTLFSNAVYTPTGVNATDRTNVQPSRTLVDASISLAPSDRTWDLALLVRNALDKEYYYYEFEAPAQTGSRIGYPGAPRTVTLQATFRL